MKPRSEILRVAESPLVEVARLAEQFPGTIALQYGESDQATPEFICRAAWEASLSGHTFYTDPVGYSELREAIASQVRMLHGVPCTAGEIVVTIGASAAITLAIRMLVGSGDSAVIIEPCYSIFPATVISTGAEVRPVPLQSSGSRFQLDLDRIRRSIDSTTRMILVNSPSNPTGWVMSEAEQRGLVELADRHDLTILSDEVYERVVYGRDLAPSLSRIVWPSDRIIVVQSFSKTYKMTGWRLGYAQLNAGAARQMSKMAEFMTSSAPAMIQQAGIAAIRGGEAHVKAMRAEFEARMQRVSNRLKRVPGLSVPDIEGAFFAFPEVSGLQDSVALAHRLVAGAGVATAPGSAFGGSGEGRIRLSFAGSDALVDEGVERFCRFLEAGSLSSPGKESVR